MLESYRVVKKIAIFWSLQVSLSMPLSLAASVNTSIPYIQMIGVGNKRESQEAQAQLIEQLEDYYKLLAVGMAEYRQKFALYPEMDKLSNTASCQHLNDIAKDTLVRLQQLQKMPCGGIGTMRVQNDLACMIASYEHLVAINNKCIKTGNFQVDIEDVMKVPMVTWIHMRKFYRQAIACAQAKGVNTHLYDQQLFHLTLAVNLLEREEEELQDFVKGHPDPEQVYGIPDFILAFINSKKKS